MLFGSLLVALVASQTANYCDRELCKKNTADGYYYAKHIACQNTGDFISTCPQERSLVPITKDLMTLILQIHNEYRRKVAIGSVPGYSKSDQMIEMVTRKWILCTAVRSK